ncbi:hypothetical protein [Nostoc sp. CHAB 5715]|uniref:hypothetical protein n=1 Tax=Nostoc sp. CHAB 5715 TaxID=2780400 RepID=UPI001E630C5E|nr:hypothetical protein [Nostoc sp. CHAB 5715]MCC5621462.1 hypothetical protein [Nostoc sp. CHAB 5715]
MNTIATTAIDEQSLSSDYFPSSLIESSLEVLNDTEFELENIMAKEFPQGLPSDLESGDY